LGEAASGSITEAVPAGLHTFAGSSVESLVVTVIPDNGLVVSLDVFGPDGAYVSGGVAFEDEPSAIVLPAPTDGAHLITVTGLEGSVGRYAVDLGQLGADWDLAALMPSFAGFGPADYWIDVGGTSTNCESWDTSGLLAEEALLFTPRGPHDHAIWVWSAHFSSPDGVDSYLSSWGSGCSFLSDEDRTIRLVDPAPLNDELLWYVTVSEDNDGVTTLDSVGVIGTSDRAVVEAQVMVAGPDGDAMLIPIDPDRPYDDAMARMIADEIVEELTRVLEGL
jgi:hypothetical protein